MRDDVRSLFSKAGLRCTRQRVAIFEALAATQAHPTAEQLYGSVRESCDGLSLATVYNTLEALCKAGLCRRMAVTHGSVRYDADLHSHIHFVDEDGRFKDVPDDLGQRLLSHLPPELIDEISERMNIRIDRVSLQLIGNECEDFEAEAETESMFE